MKSSPPVEDPIKEMRQKVFLDSVNSAREIRDKHKNHGNPIIQSSDNYVTKPKIYLIKNFYFYYRQFPNIKLT